MSRLRLSAVAVLWSLLAMSALADPLPRHTYDQRLYFSAGEAPEYTRLFLNEETEPNGLIRYEPRYYWRSGDTEWHRWDAQVRAKLLLAVGRPSSLQADDNGRIREDEHYVELRDVWVRRRMLFGSPSLSLGLGRQSYKDEEGVIWDLPLESLNLDYQSSLWRAHLVAGQQLTTFRSDDSDLDPRDEDIFRVLAGVGKQWMPGHWWDLQLHYQDDRSGDQVERLEGLLDVRDFTGYWAGIRLHGEGGYAPVVGYTVNALFQEGDLERYAIDGAGSRIDSEDRVQGYLIQGELFGRMDSLSWRPGFGVRVATTDEPDYAVNDGYFQSRVQSNRRPGVADLSTGPLGDLLDYEMNNLAYAAAWYRQQLWPRAELEVLAGSLQRLNDTIRVNSQIRNPLVDGESHLGDVVNVALGWRSFPLALSERRQMQVSARLSYSAFEMGDAYQRAEQIHQILFVIAGRW
ncbi:outer membrane alginate export protein [Alcanivorax nanhaiticus]|uniref:Outer membrane alginate export protein n=1 Tax=Alcanivorax nanhaiticus TaxID=1177154 RepID=A0A095SGB0_9GAMM|nr:alginate export family protein [Alcanivorax nanhaiticus]KGD63611.1 outer membrane alginate export protein [Alcanivorax nanhaiticus]